MRENTLSNPALVTDLDCEVFMTIRGKGWVCEIDETIVGFSIVDLRENNIWALFIHPDFENKGIGRKPHDVMLDWYFAQTKQKIWLGTSPNTRTEIFYTKSGWAKMGVVNKGEVKFEITYERWAEIKNGKLQNMSLTKSETIYNLAEAQGATEENKHYLLQPSCLCELSASTSYTFLNCFNIMNTKKSPTAIQAVGDFFKILTNCQMTY